MYYYHYDQHAWPEDYTTSFLSPLLLPLLSYPCGCSSEMNITQHSNFTSRNFPEPYLANLRQRWTIWSDRNLTLPVLRFSFIRLARFSFNSTTSCDNDRLVISHAGADLALCGHVVDLPRPIIGVGKMTVEVITDDRYEDVGFAVSDALEIKVSLRIEK